MGFFDELKKEISQAVTELVSDEEMLQEEDTSLNEQEMEQQTETKDDYVDEDDYIETEDDYKQEKQDFEVVVDDYASDDYVNTLNIDIADLVKSYANELEEDKNDDLSFEQASRMMSPQEYDRQMYNNNMDYGTANADNDDVMVNTLDDDFSNSDVFKINNTQEVIEEPAEEVIEEPAEEVIEESAGEVIEEPAEEVIEEPAEEVIEEPAEEVIEEPAEEVVEESAEEVIEEPVEEVIEESAEEVIEEPAEEVIEEPAEEVVEESAEEVIEEPVEEVIEESAEEVIEEPAGEVIEEPAEEVKEETRVVEDINVEVNEEIKPEAAMDETAIITKGLTVKGDLVAEGSVNLFGTVEGNIQCKGKLVVSGTVYGNSETSELFANGAHINGNITSTGAVKIGQGSVIIGNIVGTSAVIAGAVKGDIDVKGPVVVDSQAIVMGDIKSKSVQINIGAAIEGRCSQCYADVSPTTFFKEN